MKALSLAVSRGSVWASLNGPLISSAGTTAKKLLAAIRQSGRLQIHDGTGFSST